MNPGEPTLPLAKVASGGETARLMLALKRILSGADRLPTLIFDEIDAGIGGRIGAVVGRKLWSLTQSQAKEYGPVHQVICVTHLPQVAAYGDAHFRAHKHQADGRTSTALTRLEEGARVEELMLMLGADNAITRQSALQLLQASTQWKTA